MHIGGVICIYGNVGRVNVGINLYWLVNSTSDYWLNKNIGALNALSGSGGIRKPEAPSLLHICNTGVR